MPQLINVQQPSTQLGSAISGISNNMFANASMMALRRQSVQNLQRQAYGTEALASLVGNADANPIDPQQAAKDSVLAGKSPDEAAGWLAMHGAMNGGPSSPELNGALAAQGKYSTAPDNLDLDRGNKIDIANNLNTSHEKMAAMRAGMDAWKFNNKPMPVFVNGAPGFVRQNDPALGAMPPAPLDNSAPGAPPTYGQKTDAVESGNNPVAQNPNSSATGAGQFTNGTWMDMIGKHAPELAQGRTPQQVLALRNDPQLSQAMTNKYGEDNAAVLQSQGLPVTDGTKYLAHLLGPGGAVKALKADPNTPMASLVGPDVVQANPMLAKMTAGDTAAWANKKMGVGAAPGVTQAPAIPAPMGSTGGDAPGKGPLIEGPKQDAPYSAADLAQATGASAAPGQPPAPVARVITPPVKSGAITDYVYANQKNPDGTLAHPGFVAASAPDVSGPKNQDKLEQQFRPIIEKEINSRSGGLGLQDAKVNQAIHLRALVDQYKQTDAQGNVTYNIPTSQYHELAIGLANLVSPNGNTSDADRAAINASTATGNFNAALQYITGEPQNGNSQAMTKNLIDSIDRQGTVAENERGTYLNAIRSMAPTGLDPKRRDAIMSANLNSFINRPGAAPAAAAPQSNTPAAGGLPAISTPQDYAKLPSGAKYISPDGHTRTKQ